MDDYISEELARIRKQDLWRSVIQAKQSQANCIVLEGKSYINFSSNDYLGFSTHPKVVAAGIDALNRYGSGGRSSRLVSGTLDLHVELEEQLAKLKKTESCLLFPTGFMANLGVVAALLNEGDAILVDRLNHASLLDATKLSKCRVFVYEHASVESLEKVLHRTRDYKKRLVATDTLFSMDGDFAPIKEIIECCKRHNVWLMVDDAHATGVFGERGGGALEFFGCEERVEIIVGTLSKALGSQGGFVCGSKKLIDYLVNRARSFIFTTALSPVSCAAALASLKLIEEEPDRRKKLQFLSESFRNKLYEKFSKHILRQEVATQILPFQIGSAQKALAVAQQLKLADLYVPAIRPPTVPKNKSRLRFSLTSEHQESDIQKLIDALSLVELEG